MRSFAASLFIFCLAVGAPRAEGAVLTFSRAGREVARYTASQMQAKIQPRTVTFFDPHHGKTKSYRCLPIKAVMDLAYVRGYVRANAAFGESRNVRHRIGWTGSTSALIDLGDFPRFRLTPLSWRWYRPRVVSIGPSPDFSPARPSRWPL